MLHQSAKIGKNVLIEQGTIIRPNVTIGDNSEIRQLCFIAEDVKIGRNVKIFQLSNIGSGSIIEDCVFIGANVVLTNTRRISHMREYDPVIEPPIIKYGARIASGAIILPRVVIGRNALVGAGAVVTTDVPDNMIVMGMPAFVTGEVPENERI